MNDQNVDKTHTHVILTKGTMVSHYRIVDKIGSGGMGEVYRAEDTKLGREVALKFLGVHSSDAEESHARFINEARAAATLDHPNICPVYEIDEVDGRTFIAMAFIDGHGLDEKVKSGPMRVEEALRFGVEIARGLQEAHEKEIVHRDIKSANVMVSCKGQVKITDFGLAKLAGESNLTKTGTTMGTATYMSPEQVRGETVDHRSDIWSLGIVLYELVTGRRPFGGESGQAVTHQIVNEEARPITAVRSGIPMELDRIVSKCLEKDVCNRYQHADDLLVDLLNVDRKPQSQRRPGRLRRYLLPASIAFLAVALIFAVRVFTTGGNGEIFKNPLADATFRKLTDIEGYKDATISPDGKLVAFVSDHDGEFDIWVSQVETGSTYNRTRGEFGDMRRGLQDVGFSTNSSELIGFASSQAQPIMSIPMFDGPGRRILRDSVIMAFWSPDASRVVYFTDSPGDPVFVANADGTNNRVILSAESGMHQHYQRWSHDGEWVYMSRGREHVYDTDLWRVRTDGMGEDSSGLEQLTEDQLDVTYPAPISDRVVMFIAKDESGEGPWIWATDVETKITRKVSFGLEKYNSLSSNRDGSRLVASRIKPESNRLDIWTVPLLDSIATENDVTRIMLFAQRAQAPRFGGRALYFMASTVAGDGLWKQENGEIEEIWSGSRAAIYEVPAISPDGNTIAIALMRDSKRYLHLINSNGSNLRLLSDSIDIRGSSSFSPDGRWIVTSGYDAQSKGLFKISIVDGHYEQLTEGFALSPIWSPKGDLIVFNGSQVSGFSTLQAIRPDGKKVELPEIKVWARGERFRFLPDGSGLVYMKGWFSGLDFYLLDLSTMKSRQLTDIAKGAEMKTFDISPDGKNLVFDRLSVKTEIVLIELEDDESVE